MVATGKIALNNAARSSSARRDDHLTTFPRKIRRVVIAEPVHKGLALEEETSPPTRLSPKKFQNSPLPTSLRSCLFLSGWPACFLRSFLLEQRQRIRRVEGILTNGLLGRLAGITQRNIHPAIAGEDD